MPTAAAATDSPLRFVSLTYSQVMMLRFLHASCLESHVKVIYLHENTQYTMEEYVQSMSQTFALFRELDDVLKSALSAMETATVDCVDFQFTPLTHRYFMDLAKWPWKPSDFLYPDPIEAVKTSNIVNEQKDDLLLSLKAASLTPVIATMAAVTEKS